MLRLPDTLSKAEKLQKVFVYVIYMYLKLKMLHLQHTQGS